MNSPLFQPFFLFCDTVLFYVIDERCLVHESTQISRENKQNVVVRMRWVWQLMKTKTVKFEQMRKWQLQIALMFFFLFCFGHDARLSNLFRDCCCCGSQQLRKINPLSNHIGGKRKADWIHRRICEPRVK